MKSSQVPHELVMKLLAVLGFSSECLAGEEAASKLTHAIGKINGTVCGRIPESLCSKSIMETVSLK